MTIQKSRLLRVGLVQQLGERDREQSLMHSIDGIREAAAKGAKLILLSELHAGLYFCQTEDHTFFDFAEPIPGPTTLRLCELAHELQVVIVCSVFEHRAPGLYHNTAVVIETDGTIVGKYRKMHIPDDPGFYEKFYFTPGDLGFTPIDTSVGRLGVLVCWDQWFPEAARLMALAGAEILLYPTAIGWVPEDEKAEQDRQREAWITIQRAHAIANSLPVMVCNRIGLEMPLNNAHSGIQFWGSSFVTGPQGELLAQASTEDKTILIADIDKQRSEVVRRFWPYLRDRRIDAYAGLLQRYLK